mgnify:CR=1 FL=1
MKKKLFLNTLMVAVVMFSGCKSDSTLSRDVKSSDDPLMRNEKKITEIIKKMTLEEKIEMLHGKHYFTSEDDQIGRASCRERV